MIKQNRKLKTFSLLQILKDLNYDLNYGAMEWKQPMCHSSVLWHILVDAKQDCATDWTY